MNYIPYKGFYDLRDFIMNKTTFEKLWKIQDMLFHMQNNSAYFKRWHLGQWEKAKEISAKLQQILFQMKRTEKQLTLGGLNEERLV